MAQPVQLRYNDAVDGETVIGTYLKNDQLIEDFQCKNSGSGEYTRIELLGDNQLKNNLPIDYTQYGTAQNGESEPEILVYNLDDNNNWQLRTRVFPENQGILEDDGSYRNGQLWGFQKWVGRKRTPNKISLTNATITDIVNELLPSGYTAVTPGDDTVPILDSYSFNGKIDRGIRDLVRDFPVKIWFTSELDANNDYIVKVQSKGYGDVVQTITFDSERQTQGYSVIRFEEEDKSNIVNKVEIEGTDDNGNLIQETVLDQGSIDSHGERYIHRNVGYLQSSTQATNLGNDILNPSPSPHAKISIPFQSQNVLNASIDILDNRFGIDAVYTVVKQRDYYTEGKTEVELGFEKNRSEERRDRDRELDERNHQLFPSTNKGLTGTTGEDDPLDSGFIGENDPANSGLIGENDPPTSGQVGENDPLVTGTTEAENLNTTNYHAETREGIGISSSGYTLVSTANAGTVDTNDLYHRIKIRVGEFGTDNTASDPGELFVLVTGDSSIDQPTYIQESINTRPFSTTVGGISVEHYYVKDFVIPAQNYADGYRLYLGGSAAVDVDLRFIVDGLDHTHDATTLTADLHPHNADTGTDASTTINVDLHPHDADDGSSTLTTDLHPHDADDASSTLQTDLHPHPAGTLEAEVSEEDKTDR